MTLQPFVGPWPLLQSRNLFYTYGKAPWTSDQPVARSLLAQRTTKHRINAYKDINTLSGILTHVLSVRTSEDSTRLRPRSHRDQLISSEYESQFTVIKNG
jgi:hypothetical protein